MDPESRLYGVLEDQFNYHQTTLWIKKPAR